MTNNVVDISPYQILGKIEDVNDRIHVLALRSDDEAVLLLAGRIRELCRDLQRALGSSQRERLTLQLAHSLELIRATKAERDRRRCDEIGQGGE